MKRATAALVTLMILVSILSRFASAYAYPSIQPSSLKQIQVVRFYQAPKVGIPQRREGAGTR